MYEPLENESIVAREERILRFWNDKKIFESSVENRRGSPYFSFYDGPPFATGLPHYGHLLAGTMKDSVLRYKTLKGFYAPRRFGWDCHGLPIEQEIEKSFSLSGARAIEHFGMAEFNEECRKIVHRYVKEWRHTIERFGRWVDFSKTWTTMDPTFMESVWWVFKQVYDKGLIYEGHKVVPFSAKLGTPLSNFEAAENYKDIDDPSLVVSFPVEGEANTSLLIWTTTPWTLISNMAAAVHPEIVYCKVEDKEKKKFFILAREAVPRWFLEPQNYRVVATFTGKELAEKQYEPPFKYFSHKKEQGAFRVITADFVSVEEGTGIVHMAPAFGEDDFYACKSANIPLVSPIDQNGQFTEEIAEYKGLFVKDADKSIIRELKERGRIFYSGRLRHRYPFCWRSDTPLIYRAITSWFLKVESIKENILLCNSQIKWVPDHIKYGRFGKWLEGARDWSISRNRYWGTPIPVWKSEDGDIHVIGSVKELEELTGTKITDLHRHYIDPITFKKNGKTYRRITEVFDCWFDAGSMPYGQNHYPFENKEITEKTFPADFIAEGIDQTRGWFYTLLVLSTALFNKPAYKNVIVNGIILAEDGNKMSKRLKNYPEPEIVISKYGADAVRLYLLSSPIVKADDIRFSEKGVEQILRQMLIPLWNSLVFFHTYASIYKYEASQKIPESDAILDRWILSRLSRLVESVEKGMENYALNEAVEPFINFIDDLTNWYIRRSRRRFWEEKEPHDQKNAFDTLYYTLLTLSKIASPFVPFIADAIYEKLKAKEMPESVHLTDFPSPVQKHIDASLEEGMNALQTVVSLSHALRKESKIKVRQPLKALHIVSTNTSLFPFLDQHKDIILDELNIKEVFFHSEEKEFMHFSVKPNFKALGKRAGSFMKELQILIQNLPEVEIAKLKKGKSIQLKLEEETFELSPEDVEIVPRAKQGWIAMHAGSFTTALDIELDEPLILEGIAREIVNKINTMRKEANLAVTDRIRVHLGASDKIKKALAQHGDYVKEEILAVHMDFEFISGGTDWDINGEPASILIEKV